MAPKYFESPVYSLKFEFKHEHELHQKLDEFKRIVKSGALQSLWDDCDDSRWMGMLKVKKSFNLKSNPVSPDRSKEKPEIQYFPQNRLLFRQFRILIPNTPT